MASRKDTPDGWEIIIKPPILFRRYPHQKPQAEPAKKDDLDLLFKYINARDGFDRLLVKVIVLTSFIPRIPHVLPNVYGPSGSGKTCFSRFLRC
jgi:Cdc6-like AAA superfamily ATPase